MSFRAPSRLLQGACNRNTLRDCLILAVIVAALALCSTYAANSSDAEPRSTAADDCVAAEYAMALRYQQSAHAAAAQRQAWLLAERRLRAEVSHRRAGDRLAVVTDLDETVLDNTALLARDVEACHDYTSWDTWSDWEVHGDPLLTPGAGEFLEYADRHGVAVYYVSDRFAENKAATLATLRALGLPQVRPSHVLLYGTSKEERRAVVAERHEIVLLLGDSLPDFHDDFDGATAEEQQDLVREHARHFGRDWIMFPNATYGSWRTSGLRAWDAPLG